MITRFLNFRTAPAGDYVWAGEQKVRIEGYGTVDIEVLLPSPTDQPKRRILRLYEVAYCPGFACNLVSLRLLQKRGIWWDNRPGSNYLRQLRGSIVCLLLDKYDQFVLEYLPENVTRASFFVRRNKFNSYTGRRPVSAEAITWHLRLGHPGLQALDHLVNQSRAVKLRGPTTVECDACGVSKAKRQISRIPRDPLETGPGLRLAVDFHDFEPGLGGLNSLMLVIDRWSGLM